MFKTYISIKKEALLFLHDKVGLGLMFLMPILLVFIITIIQDSAFKMVESNQITLLVANHDKGDLGEKLSAQLSKSGMFEVIAANEMEKAELIKSINAKDALTGLYISEDFSEKLQSKSAQLSGMILADFGLAEKQNTQPVQMPAIQFYHDPVLQENYCYSMISIISAHLNGLESTIMVESIYKEMGQAKVPENLENNITKNRSTIERISAAAGTNNKIPNSTQHNVPAWTLFAMFFMVVSLGTSIVKERNSGSFTRIKTMPSKVSLVLFSKQAIYIIIAILQVIVIFGIGYFIFPLIGLPRLDIPANVLGLIAVVLVCALSAVSYALVVGSLVKTEEQSNGFGAISIIIFAALGGVWVPSFVMPDYLQTISMFSPLHWCIEGFYVLFLKGGNWADLMQPLLILLAFSIICQTVTVLLLKRNKHI